MPNRSFGDDKRREEKNAKREVDDAEYCLRTRTQPSCRQYEGEHSISSHFDDRSWHDASKTLWVCGNSEEGETPCEAHTEKSVVELWMSQTGWISIANEIVEEKQREDTDKAPYPRYPINPFCKE